jgi:hypothetical protein
MALLALADCEISPACTVVDAMRLFTARFEIVALLYLKHKNEQIT